MDFKNDLSINPSKFDSENVREDMQKAIDMMATISKGPKWYEVGAAKYRTMIEAGQAVLPKPIYLPEAREATIPSRDAGRSIPIRVLAPQDGTSKGIVLHIHGGGFVIGDHKHQDNKLKEFADNFGLTAISVGYRLAPENPYPAGINDCVDAAEYLINHSETDYGAKLLFVAGESSGGCLAALTTFQILRSYPTHELAGVLLTYGHFNVASDLPSACKSHGTPVIDFQTMQKFGDAYVPSLSSLERKDPKISPLYEDLQLLARSLPKKKLPPALFIIGTGDPLLDDNLLMSMKWQSTGSEAFLKVYPGGFHGFALNPQLKDAQDANQFLKKFVLDRIPSTTK